MSSVHSIKRERKREVMSDGGIKPRGHRARGAVTFQRNTGTPKGVGEAG